MLPVMGFEWLHYHQENIFPNTNGRIAWSLQIFIIGTIRGFWAKIQWINQKWKKHSCENIVFWGLSYTVAGYNSSESHRVALGHGPTSLWQLLEFFRVCSQQYPNFHLIGLRIGLSSILQSLQRNDISSRYHPLDLGYSHEENIYIPRFGGF